MRRWVSLLALACLMSGEAGAQSVENYPSETVRIIVPFAPGGSTDAVPRILAQKLTQKWAHPVIIENRPGAAGSTGSAVVAQAAPDGYTLLSSPAGPIVINQFVQKSMPLDPATLVPIAMLGFMPSALAVRPNLPHKTVQELVAFAKANPNKLNYASQGPGSTPHLTGIMFQEATGTAMVHVPYRGSGPALQDLIAGTVDIAFLALSSSLSLHKAGQIRILAIATLERDPGAPDIPTIDEAGVKGFESGTWMAVMAPPKTPDTIADKIARDLDDILAMKDVRERLVTMGLQPSGLRRQKLADFIAKDRAQWQKLVKAAKIEPE